MRRILMIVGGSLILLVLAGGAGFWYWHSHQASADQTTDSTGGSISLDQTSSAGNSTAPIDTSGQGSSQISLQSNVGSTSSGGSQSNSSGSASTKQTQPNPSTFKQYDQYQSSQNALFGDISTGTGTAVAAGNQVTLNYQGWLTNGTLFDQNDTAKPLVFTVGQHDVVIGMEEGVIGMKPGGSRLIVIPPAAGYGSSAHQTIPANSVLVFVVTLLSVR